MRLHVVLVAGLWACGGSPVSETDADTTGTAPDASVDVGAASVFDESVLRTYELELAPADWQWLKDNATAEEYVSATLRFEGETYANIGMRFKGSYGSLFSCFNGDVMTCDKLSIKLKFNEYEPGKLFHGLKRINLHSMEQDPTKMHDAIGYKLFRDRGVPAPRTAYARVIVNGEPLGLYVAVEAIDGRFARDRFADGAAGNLYKEVWPVHTTEAPYLAALETNEADQPTAERMVRFAQALEAAGSDGFLDTIESWMDVDQLVSYMAVARLIDHWDGIVAWYCVGECFNHNYYWYQSAISDKVTLIPWDLDHTFEEPSPIRTLYGMPDWDELNVSCEPIPLFAGVSGRPPACDAFVRGMASSLWNRYREASEELVAAEFSQTALEARIDELAGLIEDEVSMDPDSQTAAEWRVAVDDLRDVVAVKRDHVMSKF